MAQTPLNDGDTFGVQRGKINANDADNATAAAAAASAAATAQTAATAAAAAAATAQGTASAAQSAAAAASSSATAAGATAAAAQSAAASASTAAAAAQGTATTAQTAATAATAAATAATAKASSAIQSAIPFSATTGVATKPDATTFTPASGTAPPGGYTTLTCTSNPGALPAAVDGITAMTLNDSLVFAPALGVWTLQKAKLASTDLTDSTAIERIVGIFATTTALQAAFPAASNAGFKALVGAGPYSNYSSDGQSWNKGVTSSTDLADVSRRSAGTSLVLDGQADYAPYTIAGATTITISGSTRAAQATMVVIADGANAPTVTGANEWGSSFGYLNTANIPNRLDAWYDGVACRFSWSQEAVPTAIDLVAPTVSTYAVNGATLTLTYSETLKTTAPAASAFSVVGAGGITQTPASVTISGAVVTLGLGTPATSANTVTVAYTAPATNPIQDPASNVSASFTAHAVTNNTPVPDTTAPVLSSAQVNGASLTLTYGEALNSTPPAASAYSVVGAGGVTQTPTGVSIAGAVVTLTLGTPAVSSNTVTASYTVPGTNAIQDAAGNQSVAFTGRAVTNNTAAADTTAPVFSSASVNGTTLTLTYGEALASPGPAASSYSVVGAGGVTQTPSAAAISGSTVVLTLATAAVNGNTVTFSYTVPGSNPVRDAAGNVSVALSSTAVTNATAGLQAETQSWLTRVTSAGGTVSAGTQSAVDAFVAGCKSDGIFSLFRRLNLVVGDYAASQVPLVNTSGSSVDTMTSMTSADYAEATGWTTEGTAKVVKTGYVPSEATGGLFTYLRTTQASDTNGRVPIGVQAATSPNQAFRIAGNRNNIGTSVAGAVAALWGGSGADVGNQAATTGGMVAGMWHGSRSASAANALYFNGASVGTSAPVDAAAAPSTNDIWVMGLNNAGAVASLLTSGSRLAAYGLESGMSSTQAAALYSRMQTFQTAMGRQV